MSFADDSTEYYNPENSLIEIDDHDNTSNDHCVAKGQRGNKSHASVQTSHRLANAPTPSILELQRRIKEAQSEKRHLLGGINRTVSRKSHLMAKRIQLPEYKKLTEKFSPSFKRTCLNLYLSSPTFYNRKLSEGFPFPSLRKLRKHVAAMMRTVSDGCELLRMKACAMTDEQRACVLRVFQVKLKPKVYYGLSRLATVFMINGFTSNWHQLVSYHSSESALPPDKLNDLIESTIARLHSINLKVVAICIDDSNAGTTEMASALQNRWKVQFMFDIQQLVIELWKIFVKTDLTLDGKILNGFENIVDGSARCTLENIKGCHDRLAGLETVGDAKNVAFEACQSKILLTLKSVMALWKDETSYKGFLLSVESVANFLYHYRYTLKTKLPPSLMNPVQFNRVSKKFFVAELMNVSFIRHDPGLREVNDILCESRDAFPSKNARVTTFKEARFVGTSYRTDEGLKENFQKNICKYLLKKCLSVHECSHCENYAVSQSTDTENEFSESGKEGIQQLLDLKTVHSHFSSFVESMELIFQQKLENFSDLQDAAVLQLTKSFRLLKLKHPCKDFPFSYVTLLFARVRLYYELMKINSAKCVL
ncbi:unnamed protein product [Acanthoscelides obtectus]|uniref:Transposable element P transposase-like RNase H domain-containing protein n=1 Tax=Acanthoscelides obtectus TaxID=200917 RepID=A0A9P0M817_ACAOB|nr:unnamed protein product [Acanthoscelides obtectus]CAK1659453.1 hypothetical protein AOBTE_LOCUS21459 [Acanthoscelides obtectus]